MRKAILIILMLVLLAGIPAFARSTYYFKGDQVFSIRGGVKFPGFFAFYFKPECNTTDTHLDMGGYASIAYQGYISEYFALGGELSYAFNYSKSDILYTTVPITAKLTWIPVQTGRFDLAMSLNVGGAFLRYDEGRFFSPFVSVSVCPSVFINENWGIGVEGTLMLTTEFYTQKSGKKEASALAGMIPLTLVLSYRH